VADTSLRTDLRKVDLSAIRDELRRLWALEALRDDAVMRARTHNLVVYTDVRRHHIDDIVQFIIEITSARPGRVILIHCDLEAEDRVEGWVTVYCQQQNQAQVCGEMVVFDVGGKLGDEIHSTVVSLLAPDLPVYLWWMQRPEPDDHLFETLSAEAARLIIDSDFFPAPRHDFPALAELDSPPLVDLAWGKLTPWRDAVAQFWEIPELRERLPCVQRMEIRYHADRLLTGDTRALLLVGWMADRLGWEFLHAERSPRSGYETRWMIAGCEAEIDVLPAAGVEGDLPPGEIVSIQITVGEEPPFSTSHIEFIPERDWLSIALHGEPTEEAMRGYTFHPVDARRALAEELVSGYDSLYPKALRQVAAVFRSLNRS
jgi:glucose-6-phosphate dehydrogenase assembly protein OpcA